MKISVALVTYNSERFLKEQIDSILLSLGNDDEIIISDDGSSDNTIEIIKEYIKKDKRFSLYQIEHSGCNGNYENAIKHCSRDIIVLSDDDNVWEANKLDVIRKEFESNKNVTLCMHDCKIVDEKLNLIENSFIKYNDFKPGLIHNFIKSRYGGSLIAFKKELVKYILPFPKHMPFFYDDFIGMMATKHGQVKVINEPLSLWRRYSGASSTQFVSSDGSIVKSKKKSHSLKWLIEIIKVRTIKLFYLIVK